MSRVRLILPGEAPWLNLNSFTEEAEREDRCTKSHLCFLSVCHCVTSCATSVLPQQDDHHHMWALETSQLRTKWPSFFITYLVLIDSRNEAKSLAKRSYEIFKMRMIIDLHCLCYLSWELPRRVTKHICWCFWVGQGCDPQAHPTPASFLSLTLPFFSPSQTPLGFQLCSFMPFSHCMSSFNPADHY